MTVLLVTAERLHDFYIKALLTDKQTMMCAHVGPAMGAGERRLIPCKDDVYGHKIKIQIGGNKNEQLTLCEVEVHGHYG